MIVSSNLQINYVKLTGLYFTDLFLEPVLNKGMLYASLLSLILMNTLAETASVAEWLRAWDTWAQDYKEKDKLDSKQISDSAFGTHLSFCQKQETIKLFKIKLKTHSSNSGLTGSWRVLYPAGKNVSKIGTQ